MIAMAAATPMSGSPSLIISKLPSIVLFRKMELNICLRDRGNVDRLY